jgi:hypothetical protein
MAIAFMKHDAHLTADVFKFRQERHLGVFTCKRVAEGAPILHVSHEEDGDWQFLCGGQHWSVQGVEKDDGDDELPEFAYTIGLYQSYQQPEIIIVGLSLPTMSALMNICGDKVKAGEKLPLDTPVPGVLPGYQVRFRAVRELATYAEYLGYATWFYSGPEFPVIQLVWPDKAGRFHDDATAGPGLHKRQPLLP